jgi:hypothetical protein
VGRKYSGLDKLVKDAIIGANMSKTIIAGISNIDDRGTFDKILKQSGFSGEITEVVCGNYIDEFIAPWAEANGISVKAMPVDWSNITVEGAIVHENDNGKYNAAAGYMRNQEAAKYADCAIVIVKNESASLNHLIEEIKKLNKPLYIWEV